ncbi:MAG: hypothetical protein PVI43_05765, partial [Candidatus Bathyarchaeota archaeon]
MKMKIFSVITSVIICLTMFTVLIPQTNAQTLLAVFDDFERDWTYTNGDASASAYYPSGWEEIYIHDDYSYASAGLNSENIVVNDDYN